MKKKWTGERLETSIYNENTLEHLHRYAIAASFAKGKKVLDIASGEGYGSNILSLHAASVTGVDISRDAVESAKQKYKRSNLRFIEGSADKIPLEDASVDLVVSFETIEHHDKHHEMMAEIKRVLKEDGILIISTPDKENYTIKTNYVNKHHVKELFKEEFKDLIKQYFKYSSFLYQRTDFFSLITPESNPGSFGVFTGNYEAVDQSATFEHVYIIAIASSRQVGFQEVTVFNDTKMFKSLLNSKADAVRNSRAFKLGNLILKPFRLLKR